MTDGARRWAEVAFKAADTIWRSENDGRLVEARLREIQLGQVMLAMIDAVAQAVKAEREACAMVVRGCIATCNCQNIAWRESAERHLNEAASKIHARASE